MTRKIMVLTVTAMLALALFAPAALAQDDYDDDDGYAAPVSAQPLPDTGGPALLVPAAGAILLGSGIAGTVAVRRINRK